MTSRNPNGRPSRGGFARETSSIRLKTDLRAKLRQEADELGLSFVEHVENILQQHFDGPTLADAIAERLDDLQRQREEAKAEALRRYNKMMYGELQVACNFYNPTKC